MSLMCYTDYEFSVCFLNFLSFFLSIKFSLEICNSYRTLITHLGPMFPLWRNHMFDLHFQNVPKATVGKRYFKKRYKSMACILLTVSFLQNSFSTHFADQNP